MNRFDKLYNLILEELTDQQKKKVDKYTNKRSSNLTFGPMFKDERTYFPIHQSSLSVLQTPKEIEQIIDNAGYYCPDYRQGYVYKKDDKLKSKPIKLIKILSKELSSNKEQFNQLKKEFDERLKTNRKENIKCSICITYNPYDIAGMSTDRNWTSCMNLDNGCYKETPLKQVQYGGMCAYLIKEEDKNIKEPIARIAIKRFVGTDEAFIFISENRIYGDNDFAEELEFLPTVNNILKISNNQTSKFQGIFTRKDGNSYSDNNIKTYINLDNINWNTLSNTQIENISKNTNLPKYQIDKYADKLNLTIFILNLLKDVPFTNTNNDFWSTDDLYKFMNKYKNKIDFNILFNKLPSWDIDKYLKKYINRLDPTKIIKNLDYLPQSYILKNINKFNILKILSTMKNSEDLIEKIDKSTFDKIGWNKISEKCNLFTWSLIEFYEKYQKYLNWDIITKRICKQGFQKMENISYDEDSEYTFSSVYDVFRKNINYDILGSEYDFTGYNSRTLINFFKMFPNKIKLSSLLNNPTLLDKYKDELKQIYKSLKIKKDI